MYDSLEKILEICNKQKLSFWEAVMQEDCREEGISPDDSREKMHAIYQAMRESDRNYDPALISSSGLSGTDAEKMRQSRLNGQLLQDDFTGKVMERALRVAESNACMKRIVAAPTAGSCGVMPAVLLTIREKLDLPDEKMEEALYTASGIGGVIAQRACLAGAEGGCQAEIGSASAMAAGAAVYLMGGTEEAIIHSCAMALSALLGLVCDPVAGLVEVPCVKRNVTGAVNAVCAAEMALAGIRSRIPPDQVIDAMKSVGRCMATDLRETGRGGLAATPEGQRIRDRLIGGS
ncbi:MAG: L-serine ammonia-lyase, iron-sulfur-dependent, subunit alpha [Eubacterium sp.]|nr:L-serine ammonia-lyase, iron-sulfur-dependent, subunit alpha [Eubacterium sp.]